MSVTSCIFRNGSIIVDFLLELKSASSLDEVVQKANATLREQLPYENFSLRLAEFSPGKCFFFIFVLFYLFIISSIYLFIFLLPLSWPAVIWLAGWLAV